MSEYNVNSMETFKIWCNKIIPTVYDDSISYYETVCKCVDYINKMLEDTKNLVKVVDDLQTTIDQLDIVEITQKLDAMQQTVNSFSGDINQLKTDVPAIQQSVTKLSGDLTSLTERVTNGETTVQTLQEGVNTLKDDVQALRQSTGSMESAIQELQNWQTQHGDQWVIDLIKANTEPGILGGNILNSGSENLLQLVQTGKSGDYFVSKGVVKNDFPGLPAYGGEYDGYNLMLLASGTGDAGTYYAVYTAFKAGTKNDGGTVLTTPEVSRQYWYTSGSIVDTQNPVWIKVDTVEQLPDFTQMVKGLYGSVVDLGYKSVTVLGQNCEYGVFFVPGTVTEADFALMPEYGNANGYVIVVNSTGEKFSDRLNEVYWVYRLSADAEAAGGYVDKIWCAYAPQNAGQWMVMYPSGAVTLSDTSDPLVKLASNGVYVPEWVEGTWSTDASGTSGTVRQFNVQKKFTKQDGTEETLNVLRYATNYVNDPYYIYLGGKNDEKDFSAFIGIMPINVLNPSLTKNLHVGTHVDNLVPNTSKNRLQVNGISGCSARWLETKDISNMSISVNSGVDIKEGINFIKYDYSMELTLPGTLDNTFTITSHNCEALLYKSGNNIVIHGFPDNVNGGEKPFLELTNTGDADNLYVFSGIFAFIADINIRRLQSNPTITIVSAI